MLFIIGLVYYFMEISPLRTIYGIAIHSSARDQEEEKKGQIVRRAEEVLGENIEFGCGLSSAAPLSEEDLWELFPLGTLF